MTDDSDFDGQDFPSDEQLLVDVQALGKPQAKPKPGRLVGIAALALLLIVAVIVLTPSLRKDLLPQLSARAGQARAASLPWGSESLPAVPVLWRKLDLGAMPESVAQDLEQGKYYYEKRLPGNFGLAIDYWTKALARLGKSNRDGVQNLVNSAERELARQFSADSANTFVLLKQGKRDEAVALLDKMRADYLDINSPQYTWASQMLYRRRRSQQ